MRQGSMIIGPVTFDPAKKVFAATVSFEGGASIPCSLRLPRETTHDIVVPALLRQASEKRRQRVRLIRSRLTRDKSDLLPA